MKNLPKEWPEKKPVIANMLQGDLVFNEKGMDGVKGYNLGVEDCTNALPAVIESVRREEMEANNEQFIEELEHIKLFVDSEGEEYVEQVIANFTPLPTIE